MRLPAPVKVGAPSPSSRSPKTTHVSINDPTILAPMCVRRDDGKVESKRPPDRAAVFLFQLRRHSRVIAVAIAIVAVEAVGIVILVIIVIRGLIEESPPRTGIVIVAVGVLACRAARTDVVDPDAA